MLYVCCTPRAGTISGYSKTFFVHFDLGFYCGPFLFRWVRLVGHTFRSPLCWSFWTVAERPWTMGPHIFSKNLLKNNFPRIKDLQIYLVHFCDLELNGRFYCKAFDCLSLFSMNIFCPEYLSFKLHVRLPRVQIKNLFSRGSALHIYTPIFSKQIKKDHSL